MHAALGVIVDPAQPGHPAGTALLTTKRWGDTRMIKSLTRARLLALFGATIFAAAAMAPPPASADWVGEIAPGVEQPAGQAQASGFADENGLIFIPTPAQAGEIAEAIFLGTGAAKIFVSDISDGGIQILQQTPPETGLKLTIRTDRESTTPFHFISLQRVDRTGEVIDDFLLVSLHGPDGDAKTIVKLTGSFDCLGTICDGPQDGELSFSLEVLAPPE